MSYDPQQLQKTSRYLALVLRHKPSAAGIALDEHGWADVDALIAGMAKKVPMDRQLLEEIVRTDEKKRYSFNEDHTLLRANYGHSVPVQVEMERTDPPEILYHGTGLKYADSIDAQGLKKKSRLYVHLSADTETAVRVGARHGVPVLYAVRSGEMAADGYRFFRSPNGVWLTDYVPPIYLERLDGSEEQQ